jgi:hypothetical protein
MARPLIKLDTSGNGRADEWRYFQGNQLSMVKRDQDEDGTVDEIVHYAPNGHIISFPSLTCPHAIWRQSNHPVAALFDLLSVP